MEEVTINPTIEGLYYNQVCCTQSPCPCGRPLLTHTSIGDTHIQFWLNLCGVSGSWCTQGLFEPSQHLWRLWGLILNVILPFLPSCWGFSFVLGSEVSPHCHLSAVQPPPQHLPSCWGFSALGCGVSPQSHSHAVQPPRTGWHTLGHFISVNTFQRIETVQSLFSGPSEINLEIDKNFLIDLCYQKVDSSTSSHLRNFYQFPD